MKIRNPQGRIVKINGKLAEYYASKKGWQTVDESYPVHVGGPYYELSNGERVRGKDNALKAQAEL